MSSQVVLVLMAAGEPWKPQELDLPPRLWPALGFCLGERKERPPSLCFRAEALQVPSGRREKPWTLPICGFGCSLWLTTSLSSELPWKELDTPQ